MFGIDPMVGVIQTRRTILSFETKDVSIAIIEFNETKWGRQYGQPYTDVGWKATGADDYCFLDCKSYKAKMAAFKKMVKEVKNGKIKFSCKK